MILIVILFVHRVVSIALIITKRIQIIYNILTCTCIAQICVNDIYISCIFWIKTTSLRLVQSIKLLQPTKIICTHLCKTISGLKWIYRLGCSQIRLLWLLLNTINQSILLTQQLLNPFILLFQLNEINEQTFQPPPTLS